MSTLRKVLALLTPPERRQAYLLVPVVISMAMAEVVGIASIAPFLSLIADPEAALSGGVLGTLYDLLGFENARSFMLAVGGLVLVALIGSNAVLALGTYGLFKFGAMRNHSISRRLMIRYLQQPYAFFLEHNSASLANNIVQEVSQVINSVVVPGLLAIAKAVGAAAILILLIVLDPVLAGLIGAVLGGAYVLIYSLTRRHLTHMGRQRVVVNQARFTAATEAMGAIKDLKLLGHEGEAVSRYSGPSRRFAVYEARKEIFLRLPRFALEAVAFGGMIAIVLVLLVAGASVSELLPMLGVYAFAGYRMLPALNDVFSGVSKIRYGVGALDEVYELARRVDARDVDPERFLARERVEPLPFHHVLAIEHVAFGYASSDRPVLHDIDITIPALASVAFVGPTGSGKTTLVDIVLGLLTPDRGRITVDGAPIDDEALPRWQRALGYVPQSIYLTDDTVARNIALGVPNDRIDMDAVRRAATIAQIDEFVMSELDHGYRTVVGERGIRLSGGQRQRLGIARALYHDPDVLLLDEATSALDGDTEQHLFDALQRLSGKKTLITIAHRLTTVRACDTIFVMDRGRIVDEGRYDELLRTSHLFQRLAADRLSDDGSTVAPVGGHG